MAKPDRQGRKAPPAINRQKWFVAIARTRKYSRLELAAAGALSWDFTDKDTAETFVKPETVAKHINATLRPVAEAFRILQDDGWLEKITSAAPGRAARYRLSFPPQAPSASKVQQPESKNFRAAASASVAKTVVPPSPPSPPPPLPKTEAEYIAHLRHWRSVEDDDAFGARWAAEKELRRPISAGEVSVLNKFKTEFQKLLAEGPGQPSDTGCDDEIPF